MNIQPINSLYRLNSSKQVLKKDDFQQQNYSSNPNFMLLNKFNDHLISFEARVDKGLERFYEANKDRMPIPVSRYINSLEDKSRLTPLEAQRRVFIALESAKTIDDIKAAFPNEELFEDLKTPQETRATRGILRLIKEDQELLEMLDSGILKDNQDFTVYLVKKVFLEAKTIDEINEDLKNDLNEDLKAEFTFKNKGKDTDSQYIYTSTLQSLGIKTPSREYQHSLRYTRDGYSDQVGQNIKKGRELFFDSLTEEQRMALSKKSVEKIENWWESIPHQTKLDALSGKISLEEMYESYRKTLPNRSTASKSKEKSEAISGATEPRKHVHVGSKKLADDELFKKWATLNLKLYEEELSDQEKYNLNIQRMRNMTQRWAGMTSAERTDYISKMKAGSEPLRFTMIDAWNNSVDIIKDLSTHLKQNQIFKPADLLYSTEEFSEFQSKVMTEFWDNHPEYAEELGNNIKASEEKINASIKKGTFEILKKEILRAQKLRIRDIERFKAERQISQEEPQLNTQSELMAEFRHVYLNSRLGKIKSTPKAYINDLMQVVQDSLPEDTIRVWIKHLKGEQITAQEYEILQKIENVETKESNRISYALEAAFADALYNSTKDPNVFEMGLSDVKAGMYHLERGEQPIQLQSLSTGKFFNLSIKNPKIKADRIDAIYNHAKQDLNEMELADIIDRYFEIPQNQGLNELLQNSAVPISINNFKYSEVKDYLAQYGNSLTILFSEKSAYPVDVKRAFYNKIKNNAPDSIKNSLGQCILEKPNAFEKEEKIRKCGMLFSERFSFVPKRFMESYYKELAKSLRLNGSVSIETFEQRCCKKRRNASDHGAMLIFPKQYMTTEARLNSIIIEQALADVLYEVTGNPDVYSMQFEELCDNIELFALIKKFPSQERTYNSQSLQDVVTLKANRRLSLGKIEKLAQEYTKGIQTALQDAIKENRKIEFEDLLYVLNPYEGRSEIDNATLKRLAMDILDANEK
ncbi:MAG: hypothetical protein E7Z93_03495 [Cyanobacteria bacterium SIG32]|nr:hypothetical protein [Cyanobacteria bacterium SIG32]